MHGGKTLTLFHRSGLERASCAALIIAASCRVTGTPPPATGPAADIVTLASPAFGGRYPGTAGGDSAVAFIMRRYVDLRVRPAFRTGCEPEPRCGWSYVQFFHFEDTAAQNVGAIIDGTDSTLRNEYIVIGAHFDHLGQSPHNVFDPQHGFATRPGADDNASGTAAVLELARRFANRPIRRSIVVVNFDAEEEGLCGSRAFLARPPIPTRAIVLMLNFDMIGRFRGNRVLVEGLADTSATRLEIDRAASRTGVQGERIVDPGLSDHVSFADARIEAISLSTGEQPDYHRITDTADRVNMAGVARVIDFAEAIVRERDAR